MGCDIHLFTEFKKKRKWVAGDKEVPNPYYNPSDPEDWEPPTYRKKVYSDRNYALFTLLAAVRDYSGGTETMGYAKGFPRNACPENKQESYNWGTDGHSHSYHTLHALKNFRKKHNITNYSGMVNPEAAKALDEGTGIPNWWCQETSLKDWVFRKWSVEGSALDQLIEALEKHKAKVAPNCSDRRMRIVFWFDN